MSCDIPHSSNAGAPAAALIGASQALVLHKYAAVLSTLGTVLSVRGRCVVRSVASYC